MDDTTRHSAPNWFEQGERSAAIMAASLAQMGITRADDQVDAESYCHRCRRPNTVWSAPSPLWNAVMRDGSINGVEQFGGIVCLGCFAQLAEGWGVAGHWYLSARKVYVGLETVTPSGRVWDEATQLWREPLGRDVTCSDERTAQNEAGA
jgi:hypothetical protein